ncbi:MAG: type I glyceraldehyde-3-phosphate dehydrogenase [Patescibacteria group bacterium]
MRLAINGFGRIGRSSFRVAFEKEDIEIVAINDLTENNMLAHLLKYDTAFGKFDHEVNADSENLYIDGKAIPSMSIKDPRTLPWKDLNVDVVLECTGIFTKEEDAKMHLEAGAKKVLISAPAKGNVDLIVLGTNDDKIADQQILSNASCTTNCITPVVSVIDEAIGIEKAMMTTIHSYTADQNLQDGPHEDDLRRARAAAQNIVPTTTGAAKATTKIMPNLAGKFDGLAIRVPAIDVSLSDITMLVKKDTTIEEVNKILQDAAKSDRYKGILDFTEEELVSSDFIKNTYSSIVDGKLTQVVDGNLVKIIAWYDNEWGYSNRLVELAERVGS